MRLSWILLIGIPWLEPAEANRRCLGDDQPAVEQPAAAETPMSIETIDVATSLSGLTAQQFTELVDRIKQSIVVVTFSGRSDREQGLGAGFVIRDDGLIATNLHVIGEARPIQVRLRDGRQFPVVEIVAAEKSQDLAILKINAQGLPALSLEPDEPLKLGQPIFSIGNPQGLEYSVVTGVASGFRENEAGMSLIQLAIPIERGNSGGPLLDMQGHVHGLLTLKSQVTDNLGYAVRSAPLISMLADPHPIPMSRWLTIGKLNQRYWTFSDETHWTQRAGQIHVSGTGAGFGGRALCLWNAAPPAVPYEVAVSVNIEQADGAAGLVVHADGGDRHYGFYPSSGKLRFTRFDGPTVYDWHVLNETRSRHLLTDDWNRLRVRVEQDRMICFCNDEQVFEIRDSTLTSGKIGIAKFRHTTASFKQFQVGETIPSQLLTMEQVAALDQIVDELPLSQPPATADLLAEHAKLEPSSVDAYARRLELQAQRMRELGRVVRQQRLRSKLLEVLSPPADQPVDLAHASLILAAIDNPDVDITLARQQVDDLALDFQDQCPDNITGPQRLQRFHQYLFEELGFHGSKTNYYHASNSYLNEVIDDREGLPITLSALYIEIGRRVGISADGIGLPGHFIVRVNFDHGDSQLVDVFEQGKFLNIEDCQALLREQRGLEWSDEYLQPQSGRQIIERMLRNLVGLANERQDAEAALCYVDTLLALEPNSAQDHLLKAVLCYSSRRISEGLREVNWILTAEPEEIDLVRIRQLESAFRELDEALGE